MAGLITNYIAKGTGTPSAAPSVPTGENAFYLDESNNLLYVYDTTTATWLKVGPYTLSAGTTGAIGGVRIDKAPASGDPIAITAAGMTPAGTTGAPTSGTYLTGELYVDSAYALYICSAGGTPGTWQPVSGGGGGVGYSESVLGSAVTLSTSAWTDVLSLVLAAGTYVLDADCEMHFTSSLASGAVQLINGAGTVLCGRGIGQSPTSGSFPVHLRRNIVSSGETVKVQGKLFSGSTGTIQPDDGVFGGTTGTILTALKIA